MSRHWLRFVLLFAATLAVKLLLASAVPLTTDEAYYRLFGIRPALGYHDHPPAIGWLMWAALRVGDVPVAIRLPAVLLSNGVGLLIFLLLRRRDPGRAFLVSAFWLLSPANLLYVIVTTDAPLLFFTFLSALLFHRALETGDPAPYLLAGIALGLAFLSKYFAVLLGAGYLVHWLSGREPRPRASGMALLAAGFLPALALNLGWNAAHDWNNLLFNLAARQPGFRFRPEATAAFVAGQLYLATPPLLVALARGGIGLLSRVGRDPLRLFAVLYATAATFFLCVSAWRSVGLHWSLSFLPFLFLLLFLLPEPGALPGAVRSVARFSGIHLVLLAVLLLVPLPAWRGTPVHPELVHLFRGEKIARAVSEAGRGYRIAASSYSMASRLGYELKGHVPVFGVGSAHGRQDDLWTDFRELDGGNLLIVSKRPPPRERYEPYFGRTEYGTIEVEGVAIHLVYGCGFRYAAYRDVVIREIRDRYYPAPGWLPHGGGGFVARYFGPPSPSGPVTRDAAASEPPRATRPP